MTAYIIAYLAAAVAFVVIDMVWLGLMAPRLYFPIMGDIVRNPINLPAAIAFYALYPVGLVIFAVAPALSAGSLGHALLYGALFGFFTYLTYDLTSLAVVRNYNWTLVLVDMAWGTVLGCAAAGVAYLATSYFVR